VTQERCLVRSRMSGLVNDRRAVFCWMPSNPWRSPLSLIERDADRPSEAVARLRRIQNVACGFPARSLSSISRFQLVGTTRAVRW